MNRLELSIWHAVIAAALMLCNAPPGDALGTRDAAAPAAGDSGAAGAESKSGGDALERLETVIAEGVVAVATALPDGRIDVDLRDERSGRLLARGWLSPADRTLEYTLLRPHGEGERGEVLSIPFEREPTLANANLTLGELWLGGASAQSSPGHAALSNGGRAFEPYDLPGCHFTTIPYQAPNERNLCVQECCAIKGQWEAIYLCDFVPDSTTLLEWREILRAPSSMFADLPYSPCAVGAGLFASCIANCGLLPPQQQYGGCAYGQSHCHDTRCGGTSKGPGSLYCAADCYSDPSPCDVKPQGSQEFCNILDSQAHDCEDGSLRRGYWAASCQTTMSSCECRNQDLWRCVDDRCPAGRNGYCADELPIYPSILGILPDEQMCDPSDTRNPCCGGISQPCCERTCESGGKCIDGMCGPCGSAGQLPCNTPDGLRCNDGLDFRGHGECEPCGQRGMPGTRCCTNSEQYYGRDSCPNSADACIDDRCTECGYGTVQCCPEGIMYGESRFPQIKCSLNAPCVNGQCTSCGEVGEPCCPGGDPWDKTNFCFNNSVAPDWVQCVAGTCREPAPTTPPPTPPAPAAWALVGPRPCGLNQLWTLKNVGETRGDAKLTVTGMDCIGLTYENQWLDTFRNIPPGATQEFYYGWAGVHFKLFANGVLLDSSSCGCPF